MRNGAWLQGACGLLTFGAAGLAACEDPPVPTHQGGFFVQFTDSTASCLVMNHQRALGSVGETGKPELIADGASDASVVCTVKKAGSGFIVEADLESPSPTTIVKIEIDSLSDTQATEADGALGQLQYASDQTTGNIYAAPPTNQCVFWVDTAQGQYLKPGEAWFSFHCLSVMQGMQDCEVEGFVALKNCTGLPTEDDE
jgi:hypothetical protein